MDNYWGELADTGEDKAPKQILEEQAGILKNLTRGVVYATVTPAAPDGLEAAASKFMFDLMIKSMHYDKYRYRVLTIEHDSHFYPLSVYLNENIDKEIRYQRVPPAAREPGYHCDNEEQFLGFLKTALQSAEVKSIIGTLIKLAK